MTNPIDYTIYINDKAHNITITPVHQNIAGGDIYVTGVFRLTEGAVNMGDIVFDDNMNQWEYTATGDLTHENAAEIAAFIQVANAQAANSDNVA